MLLALSIGLFPITFNASTVRAVVRHQGPPTPFEIVVRTRANRTQPWRTVEGVSYFPRRLMTNPLGRPVTVRLPATGLDAVVQICAYIKPPPPQQLQVSVGLLSCANRPKPSGTDLASFSPMPASKAVGWRWPLLMAPPADRPRQNAPA